MSDTFRNCYAALVASGQSEAARAQAVLVEKLGQREERLAKHRLARKSSSLGWLFSRRETPGPMKGLYVWGDVGRGKTMLMDLFCAASEVRRKRRADFHEFIADAAGRGREARGW